MEAVVGAVVSTRGTTCPRWITAGAEVAEAAEAAEVVVVVEAAAAARAASMPGTTTARRR